MQVDEVVKALRCEENLGSEACKECVYGQKESLCFCLDSEAADLLERLQAKLEAITKDRDQLEDYICVNDSSDNCTEYVEYKDGCEEWEERGK